MTQIIASIIIAHMLASAGVSYFIAPPAVLTPAVYKAVSGAPEFIPDQSRGVVTSAHTVFAVDEGSGVVLYQSGKVGEPYPIASITKLVTALTFLEFNPGWDVEVELQAEDLRPGGRQYLWPGEIITVRQLFELLLVSSSNEAAVALSRVAATDNFVAQMNEQAKRIGMQRASFVDPTGLSPLNVASAQDVARLATIAFHNSEIAETAAKDEVRFEVSNNNRRVRAESTDQLLGGYLTQDPYQFQGAKTGYLDEAGYCFVIRIAQDGHPVTLVTLGAASQTARWQEAKGVLEWIFNHYRW